MKTLLAILLALALSLTGCAAIPTNVEERAGPGCDFKGAMAELKLNLNGLEPIPDEVMLNLARAIVNETKEAALQCDLYLSPLEKTETTLFFQVVARDKGEQFKVIGHLFISRELVGGPIRIERYQIGEYSWENEPAKPRGVKL